MRCFGLLHPFFRRSRRPSRTRHQARRIRRLAGRGQEGGAEGRYVLVHVRRQESRARQTGRGKDR